MHPVLFKLGWFEVHSFGVMLLISFLIGINLAVKRAKLAKVNHDTVVDLSIILIIAGLLGARGMYVVFHMGEFQGRMLDIINPFQSDGTIGIAGLTVLGGVILSILSSILFLRYKKTPILPVLNVIAPSVALGFAITRVGCFMHGCCFGTPLEATWSVTFPIISPASVIYLGEAIHPAQLYASFAGAINFILLLLSERYNYFKHTTFFTFLIFYGISRFIVDIFRYYESSMILFYLGDLKISVNQGLSFPMIIIGIIMIQYINRKSVREQ